MMEESRSFTLKGTMGVDLIWQVDMRVRDPLGQHFGENVDHKSKTVGVGRRDQLKIKIGKPNFYFYLS